MKNKILSVLFLSALGLIIFNTKQTNSHTSGAPAGKTGSPGDGSTCTSCHAGPTPQTQTGWITSNIPGSGYVPGTTYTITATATRANHSKFGFEVSPQNNAGTLLGTLIATNTTATQLVGSGKYITHTSSGTTGTSGSHTWSFDWTAPSAGTGAVTFYGAFNITNSSGTNQGDTIYKSTLAVSENVVSAPTATVSSSANATCNGSCNGSATASVTGGTSPYTFLWSNGKTTASITGLCAGTFTITVTDVNSATSTTSVTISQPAALSPAASATGASCNGTCNGTLSASVSGGTSPYSFSWSGGLGTGSSKTNVCAGTYTVTITDANNCTVTASAAVSQPSAITVSVSSTNTNCGNSTGTASAGATGGASPYTYLWNNGATSATLSGLPAGAYTVTITDAGNCTGIATASVNNFGAPQTSVSSQTNVSCNGGSNGSAAITATGGASPYAFLWSSGATSASLSGLAAGNYSVSVTSANNCTSVITLTIAEPAVLNASDAATEVSCSGGNNGTAVLSVNGGTSPYSYLWSDNQTTQNVTGLTAGTYTVAVTDTNNCTDSTMVIITEPTVLSASVSSSPSINNTCNGSATLTLNGGTSPYSYLWNDSAATASATVNNLCSGNYSVIITDANGCSDTAFATVADSLTGISENNFITEIKIFPNPNSGNFTMELFSQENQIFHLNICNMMGEVIHTEKISVSSGKTNKQIFLAQDAKGFYHLQFISEKSVANKTFIVR